MSLPHRTLSGNLALGLHHIFVKAVKSLGSEEQIAKWVPISNEFRIIATYAQTELGHGEPGPTHVSGVIDLYTEYESVTAGGSQGSGQRGGDFF